jgi:hypothetical protein
LLMLGFPQTYRQAVTYRCVSPEPIAGAHRSPTQFAPQAQREDGARVPPSTFRCGNFFCFPQTNRPAVTYRCVCPEPIAGTHRSPTQFAPQAQREDGARVPRSALSIRHFCCVGARRRLR